MSHFETKMVTVLFTRNNIFSADELNNSSKGRSKRVKISDHIFNYAINELHCTVMMRFTPEKLSCSY